MIKHVILLKTQNIMNINMDLLQFYIILEKIRKFEKPKEKLSFDDIIWGLG